MLKLLTRTFKDVIIVLKMLKNKETTSYKLCQEGKYEKTGFKFI